MKKIILVLLIILIWTPFAKAEGVDNQMSERIFDKGEKFFGLEDIPMPQMECIAEEDWVDWVEMVNESTGSKFVPQEIFGVYLPYMYGEEGAIGLRYDYCASEMAIAHELAHHFALYMKTDKKHKWMEETCQINGLRRECARIDTMSAWDKEELFAQLFEMVVKFDMF